jgi:hypothetical protein
MGEAKRRGTFAARKASPKGDKWRKDTGAEVDVAETSVITRQMTRRFGFRTKAGRRG